MPPRCAAASARVAIERLGEGKARLEAGLGHQLLDRLVVVRNRERLAPGVQPHALEARPGHDAHRQVGVLEETVDDLGGDVVAADQLDVAGLDRGRQRLGVDDRRDRHLVELGPLRIVVVVEALEHDRLAELVAAANAGAASSTSPV